MTPVTVIRPLGLDCTDGKNDPRNNPIDNGSLLIPLHLCP
jgi:hypothetical protein